MTSEELNNLNKAMSTKLREQCGSVRPKTVLSDSMYKTYTLIQCLLKLCDAYGTLHSVPVSIREPILKEIDSSLSEFTEFVNSDGKYQPFPRIPYDVLKEKYENGSTYEKLRYLLYFSSVGRNSTERPLNPDDVRHLSFKSKSDVHVSALYTYLYEYFIDTGFEGNIDHALALSKLYGYLQAKGYRTYSVSDTLHVLEAALGAPSQILLPKADDTVSIVPIGFVSYDEALELYQNHADQLSIARGIVQLCSNEYYDSCDTVFIVSARNYLYFTEKMRKAYDYLINTIKRAQHDSGQAVWAITTDNVQTEIIIDGITALRARVDKYINRK